MTLLAAPSSSSPPLLLLRPALPRPVHAAAATASRPALVALAATREPPDHAGQPALHPLRAVISFRDDTWQFRGAPATVASSGILVDIDTNHVLWALEPYAQRHRPAPLLVSSIVALENFLPDGGGRPADAVVDDLVETRMGLHAGERLTIRGAAQRDVDGQCQRRREGDP